MSRDVLRLAVIESSWHADIVESAANSFIYAVQESTPTALIERFRVPGAFEIPLKAQRIARARSHHAIAACGFVVDGGIYRHDFVAHSVVSSLMQIQLAEDVPIFSAVLTPHQFDERSDDVEYFTNHMHMKGRELADALSETLHLTHLVGQNHGS